MSSFQNGTYGFGTVLTADRETLDSEQPSKKARVLPPATSANEVIQFHFVDSWKQVCLVHGKVLRGISTGSNKLSVHAVCASACQFPSQ